MKKLAAISIILLAGIFPPPAFGQISQLGDLDGDGVATVRDIAKLQGLINGTGSLTQAQKSLADLDRNGAVNAADADLLVQEILETRTPEDLPKSTIRFTSPSNGEGSVSVTRETIIHFTIPLALTTTIDTTKFYAEFGGKKILSRVELAGDRMKATLFYLEPLPSNARVKVTFDGSGMIDLAGREIDPDADGVSGGEYKFGFDTLSTTAVSGTAVVGRVLASTPATGGNGNPVDVPLAGVTVTVDGQEETLRAVTDAQGNFILDPAPAGNFFVHIDGRTSPGSNFPSGDYYPVVGKEWTALAGRTDNLAGGSGTIHLPLIRSGALTAVSPVANTKVEFLPEVLASYPELAGTEITIPANALFADNGTRGGMVGIAPVSPDRLPEPLPEGLAFPIVITIQTDGATNFDQPVPVCFPNLPDPTTGEILPPGAKSAYWSFNHDLGLWEIVGPMTVSADGKFVVTDPGVGVRQPGWGGAQPGSGAVGGPPVPRCVGQTACDKISGNGPNPPSTRMLQSWRAGAAMMGGAAGGAFLGKVSGILGDQFIPGRRIGSVKDFLDAVKKIRDAADELEDALNSARRMRDLVDECILSFAGDGGGNNGGGVGPSDPTPPPHPETRDLEDLFPEIEDLIDDLEDLIDRLGDLADLIDQGGDNEERRREYERLRDEFLIKIIIGRDLGSRIGRGILRVTPRFDPIEPTAGFYYLVEENSGRIEKGMLDVDGSFPQLVLTPDRDYQLYRYFEGDGMVMYTEFRSSGPGVETRIPIGGRLVETGEDLDGDGLGVLVELILCTDPDLADTDDDGISDGAEIEQGTNPLSKVHPGEGIIARVPSAGPILDLCTINNIAVTANGLDGITIYNVFSGLNPRRIAELRTPGSAQAVACAGNLIAVADFTAGVTIVDLSDPANVRVRSSVAVGAPVRLVTADGPVAYAADLNSVISVIDLSTGLVIDSFNPGMALITDMAITNGVLYLAGRGELLSVPVDDLPLMVSGRATWNPDSQGTSGRLSMGNDFCYVSGGGGYRVFEFDPVTGVPTLLAKKSGTPGTWIEVVPDGTGGAVASVNGNLEIYDVNADHRGNQLIETIATNGRTGAISLYNGLAYVADGSQGMLVVNYEAYDDRSMAPSISLAANFDLGAGSVERGRLLRLRASVQDDVRVRKVEFLIDGAIVLTDGNFPFEFTSPVPDGAGFRVQARAIDTGGNSNLSVPFDLSIVADATPPSVAGFMPADGSILSSATTLSIRFAEAIDPGSLAGGLTLVSAGPDGIFGNGDDLVIGSAEVSFRNEINTAFVTFENPLASGLYRFSVTPDVRDLAGNMPSSATTSTFRIASDLDSDGDGLPDDWELRIGTNPALADTDGDGTPDGDEDADNDRLSNRGEILLGRIIDNPDSNNNSILDGDEDGDLDGLRDGLEVAYGTDAANPDTDGDGDDDSTEIFWQTDPLLSTSFSPPRVVISPLTFLNASPLPEPVNPAVSSGIVTFENQ